MIYRDPDHKAVFVKLDHVLYFTTEYYSTTILMYCTLIGPPPPPTHLPKRLASKGYKPKRKENPHKRWIYTLKECRCTALTDLLYRRNVRQDLAAVIRKYTEYS